MKPKFQLFLFFCLIVLAGCGQKEYPPFHQIGDHAPSLHIREWIKGTPVQNFEKGRVYVLEFWATWCRPCIAGMPHLSALAREYKDRVTFLAIDVYEQETTSLGQVKFFVDSLGQRMDLNVAVQDSNLMAEKWLIGSGEKQYGIPRTIVVDARGIVAWTGHPSDLHKVLPEIVNDTWDIKAELSKRSLNRYLDSLDRDAGLELLKYTHRYMHIREIKNMDPDDYGDLERPDSVLIVIDALVRKEPRLKFAPNISSYTFSALLKTNPQKAYEFGKDLIANNSQANFDVIISNIDYYSNRLNIPAEIYHLGAEAYQMKINQFVYPEILDMNQEYRELAAWHRRAGDKSKAMQAENMLLNLQ